MSDAVIVEGEADESDNECISNSSRVSIVHSLSDRMSITWQRSVDDNEGRQQSSTEPCPSSWCSSVLHHRLNDDMRGLRQHLAGARGQLYRCARSGIGDMRSRLLATYSLNQSVSYHLRLASNDLFHLEDSLDFLLRHHKQTAVKFVIKSARELPKNASESVK